MVQHLIFFGGDCPVQSCTTQDENQSLPISGFSDKIIFAAYKQQYEMLESKGHVIRLNFMDSQAS
jgi:hypothetical protein